MREEHTVYASIRIGDVEIDDVPLDVIARYCPWFRGTRDEPEEPEHYEVVTWKVGSVQMKTEEAIQNALSAYLMDDLDGKAIEAAEARRDALRELCPIPRFPALEKAS